MSTPKSRWIHLLEDESGQDLVEYALILAFISLVSIASLNRLSNTLAQVPNAIMYQFWVLAYG